ncbi:LemA family protein [Marinilactibacillus psychrotolerans]|uniref:LemA family protein n=2 Tax=Marinilactibacillus psychrotolerans TaxID=191770 RepID=A0A511GZD4_9LACT|nr:LemA family protein [Marinilactibacillus psychrotolerans]TLQ09626.1 LemA family protein [Marinilactibacillus psychrotolerans]SDC83006.1 LemA protein [Marinilactibacillus psychrotolerans]SJN31334.1 LemA family protein [Marinilactibacillus psychrotolerans 42ea]GEL66615.1 LemA family protein [Marinilactibacillus psychrotolerans]GEQ32897.1 LemA family protein [Marinilactibacillus psychrotolerans]
MSTKMKVLVGAVLAVILMGIPLVGSYNSLIESESKVDSSWAQVESQLQRRYDLIPNLVNSVQGAMDNEQEIFTAIADARAGVTSAESVDESIEANQQLGTAVRSLMVSVEDYPELKSNENVTALMDELAGTENRIATERGRFNEVVRSYNTKVKSFPTSIFASIAGFDERPYFEANEGAEDAPAVDFE